MHPLSIIIPVLNEEDYLPQLLQSIVDQENAGTYEVIVVDGRSKDATKKKALRFKGLIPNLRVLSHARGISRQRNYGAAKAKYSHLVFIDGDTQLEKHALQRLSQHFNEKKDFVATPHLVPLDGNVFDRLFAAAGNLYFRLVSKTRPTTSGMCIITTKDVHEAIGGFNESLQYAEDIDYGMRAFRKGYAYHVFPDVIVQASTRRLEKSGRVELGITWLRWHYVTYTRGAHALQGTTEYEFGNFSKKPE